MQTLRHLVCGTDFSPYAEHALRMAITLAQATNARLTVVHVCDLAIDLDDHNTQRCSESLVTIINQLRNQGMRVDGVLRSGKPWEKLDNMAVEVGASLIVVGRHGAHRGQAVAIGSVAENLVRSASRDVLTVVCAFDSRSIPSHLINSK